MFLLVVVLLPVASAFTTTTTTTNSNGNGKRSTVSSISSRHHPTLFVHGRPDLDITFGSEADQDNNDNNNNNDDTTTTTNQPDYSPTDLDDDPELMERWQRQEQVQSLLAEHEASDKQRRKQKLWGAFANVTSPQELQPLLAQEQQKYELEQARKAALAAQSGITLELLEPMDQLEDDDNDNGVVEDGTVQLKGGSSTSPLLHARTMGRGTAIRAASSQWYADVDEELEQEWKALVTGRQTAEEARDGAGVDHHGPDGVGGVTGSSSRRSDKDDDTDDNRNGSLNDDEDGPQLKNGQVVWSRPAKQGVRVGSAGGWSLEVFPGDFVVHRKFGIGRFEQTCLRSKTKLTAQELSARDERRGQLLAAELRALSATQGSISQDDIQGIRSRFGTDDDTDPISNPQTTVLEITYADAVVHVPVDRAYRLSRYRAGDAVIQPKLSRVRGEAWSKAKKKVEENTLQLAQDVLALYATRETLTRPPFDPLLEPQGKHFAQSTFPYNATSDQIKCFDDCENDMVWRNRPMDRLVVGDVGFGKTEVAIRALYRCVVNGRQAALLAPTGVLAAQHYKNMVKRMGPGTEFNVNVALLRGQMGKTTKVGRLLREDIASGAIDLVVGTHALLTNDMKFKDLGLLVVDEEQRFGVKQKERLKLICEGIDVLTLSATPIPRTLQMSLSGIRDTSTIRSPPPMRKPTITHVQEFNKDIVKQAIGQELERGGQCYYVVPRISMLQDAEDLIVELFPDIKIIQAHGRMQRNGAEENVAEFAEGNYDILLATTVIENGVDIPTVNTIIIQNSQAFGMSTMYQLRGRVGRSDRQAYAYFLHQEGSVTEQAFMRLQAIGELYELGSGFDVANRDLEIRGAGSLLGTEQSGMAAKVGFDLYMRMLKKSIRKLRGLDVPYVPRTNFLMLPKGASVEIFEIPTDYIADKELRQLEETKARLAESTVKLVELTNEWKEKYGPIPAAVQLQLKTMHLHACTRRLGIDLAGLVLNEETGKMDCVLRSPGLRPRHWAMICALLPRGVAPKELNVIFPSRFTGSLDDVESQGGKKLDLKALLADDTLGEDNDEDDWDAIDQEEIEAMKQISSALAVDKMDDVDIEQNPRFVVPNLGKTDAKTIDKLLKVFLPVSKVVYERQEQDKDTAVTAANLREKQSLLQTTKKQNERLEARRMGYMT